MNKPQSIQMKIFPTSAVFLLLVLAGCATSLDQSAMKPTIQSAGLEKKNYVIEIGDVNQGEIKTDPMLRSIAESGTISAGVFRIALYTAISDSGLFTETQLDRPGDLKLETDLVSQEIKVGYPATATLFVHYKLTDSKRNAVIWEKSIVSLGKSPASEAFRDRQKLANERAAKDNLERLLRALTEIDL